jgi:hypothetical protein
LLDVPGDEESDSSGGEGGDGGAGKAPDLHDNRRFIQVLAVLIKDD